jgi:hypothetical protein
LIEQSLKQLVNRWLALTPCEDTSLTSDSKIISAPLVVMATILRSRLDVSPVKLNELQFWISKLTGCGRGVLAAPVNAILGVPGKQIQRVVPT